MKAEVSPTFLDLVEVWAEEFFGTYRHKQSDSWLILHDSLADHPDSSSWNVTVWFDGVIVGTYKSDPGGYQNQYWNKQLLPSDPKFFSNLEAYVAEVKSKCQ